MRVRTRRVPVDCRRRPGAGLGLLLGERRLLGSTPARRSGPWWRAGVALPRIRPTSSPGRWRLSCSSCSASRSGPVWPRSAFVVMTVGVGGFLAVGHGLRAGLLAPALGVLCDGDGAADTPVAAADGAAAADDHRRLLARALARPARPAPVRRSGVGPAVVMLPAMIGLLRRSRRENERAAREQDLRRHAYEERMRIAREVHDVVGHSLSVINMQAGVALHVLDRRPEQVAESLEAIKTDQQGGPGGAAEHPGGLPRPERRSPELRGRAGPARRPGHRVAQGRPDGELIRRRPERP